MSAKYFTLQLFTWSHKFNVQKNVGHATEKICFCCWVFCFFLRRLKLLIVFFFKLVDFLLTCCTAALSLSGIFPKEKIAVNGILFIQTCIFHNKVNNQFQSVKMSNKLKFQLFGGN